MSTVNIPLLRKALDWVEEQDALPYQGNWHQPLWSAEPQELRVLAASIDYETGNEERVEYLRGKAECGTAYCVAGYVRQVTDPDDPAHPEEFAKVVLGLGHTQALRLFRPQNTAADIRRIAEDIAGERL